MTFKESFKNLFMEKPQPDVEYHKSEEIEEHLREKQEQLDDDIDFKDGVLKAVNEIGLSVMYDEDSLEGYGRESKVEKVASKKFIINPQRARLWLSENMPLRSEAAKDKTLDSISCGVIETDLVKLEKNSNRMLRMREMQKKEKKRIEDLIKQKEKEYDKSVKETDGLHDMYKSWGSFNDSKVEQKFKDIEEGKKIKMDEINDLKLEITGGVKSDGSIIEGIDNKWEQKINNFEEEKGFKAKIEKYLQSTKIKQEKLNKKLEEYQKMNDEVNNKKVEVFDHIKKYRSDINKFSKPKEAPSKEMKEEMKVVLRKAEENHEKIIKMMEQIQARLSKTKTDIKEVNQLVSRVQRIEKKATGTYKGEETPEEITFADLEYDDIGKKTTLKSEEDSIDNSRPSSFGRRDWELKDDVSSEGDDEGEELDNDLKSIENDINDVDSVINRVNSEKPEVNPAGPDFREAPLFSRKEPDWQEDDDSNDDAENPSVKSEKKPEVEGDKKDNNKKTKRAAKMTGKKHPSPVKKGAVEANQQPGDVEQQEAKIILNRDIWARNLPTITSDKDRELFIEACGKDNTELTFEMAKRAYLNFLVTRDPTLASQKVGKIKLEGKAKKVFRIIKENAKTSLEPEKLFIGFKKTKEAKLPEGEVIADTETIPAPEQKFSGITSLEKDKKLPSQWLKELGIDNLGEKIYFLQLGTDDKLNDYDEETARKYYKKLLEYTKPGLSEEEKDKLIEAAFKK